MDGFNTKGKRDAHHRRMHQVSTIERIEIGNTIRSVDRKFVCECGIGYHRVQALKHHKQDCYASIAMIESDGNRLDQEEGMMCFTY